MRASEQQYASGDHVVQFYNDDADLARGVGGYLAAGLIAGEAAIVIATAAHRYAIEAVLAHEGVDVGGDKRRGAFVSLDAEETLAALKRDGPIDREAFGRVVGGLLRATAAPGRPTRAYGEMVSLLWNAGDVVAALELEKLWNELARELSFTLFCSYRAASVAGSEHADALERVSALHSAVLERPASHGSGGAERALEPPVAGRFPADADAPWGARQLVIGALRRWGVAEEQINDAALAVSELASNAVRHAGSPFSVSVERQQSSVRLAVADERPLELTAGGGSMPSDREHGLGVVDAIAIDWGFEDTAEGKAVWARLPA